MTTITVYTTGPACMQCTMTKRALTAAGVAFTEVDIRTNDAAAAYVTDDLGYTQAPVVVVDENDHWSGFQPAQITRISAA